MTRAEAVERINAAHDGRGRGGVGIAIGRMRKACLRVLDEVAAQIRADMAEDTRIGWETKGEMRGHL